MKYLRIAIIIILFQTVSGVLWAEWDDVSDLQRQVHELNDELQNCRNRQNY